MASSLIHILSSLRPSDADFSEQEAWLIQVYRLLSVLATLLIPVFGVLYEFRNPAYVDPWSVRLTMSALFGGLFGLSYVSSWAQRHYTYLMWGCLYALLTWICALTALNQVNGDYSVALVFVFCVVGVCIGIGIRRIEPLVWFLGYGVLSTIGIYFVAPSPQTSSFALIGCTATLSIVLHIAFRAALSMRQQLEAAREEANAASQLKSALLANMSHEVRTPLTSILGFAELIADADPDNPEALAQSIRRSGRRLLDTLDSVLQVSRLESGAVDLDLEPLDVGEVVNERVEAFEPTADQQEIQLAFRRDDDPVEAEVDADATKRIVEELVRNAIDFSEAGDRVYVTVRAHPERVTITVADTGVGMNAERLDELLRPFEQASVGQDRTHEGVGLGLTVAHRLVHLMNGSVEVDSEKGEGTRVIVAFPRPSPAAASTRPSRAARGRTPIAERS